MNWRSTAAVFFAPLVLASACAGRPHGPPRGVNDGERAAAAPSALLIIGFDADADLAVTAAEVDAGGRREFARADRDADGVVSPFEYNAWAEAALGGLHAPRRLAFDSNVDNSITAAEFAAALQALMRSLDANGDGRIVRAELVRERPQAMAAQQGAPPPPTGGGARRRPPT